MHKRFCFKKKLERIWYPCLVLLFESDEMCEGQTCWTDDVKYLLLYRQAKANL